MSVFLFFFFKQKTAYEMRISDWSSDVCSSDLADRAHLGEHPCGIDEHPAGAENERFDDEGGGFAIRFLGGAGGFERVERGLFHAFVREGDGVDVEQQGLPGTVVDDALADRQDRKRVVWGKSVSVRVDIGGRGSSKKKK